VGLVTVNNEIDLTKLVSRIIKGDARAEEELINRYAEVISIIIGQKIQRRDVIEDISQDVFKIAIGKIRNGDVRDPERLSGFICGIARTRALEHFRKVKYLSNQGEVAEAELITDSSPNQLERLCSEERDQIVRRVIDGLKIKRDREIIYRYYINEEDKDKICADMHLTRAQFNNVVSRALQRYKDLYIKLIGEP
jgi:RNA polymerase sigma-70 factor (ECF subfamily)